MRRLDRYLFREILAPLGLGVLVYTFILLTQFLFRSAEMIIRRGLPPSDVGLLLLFTLPNIVVLTLPMGLLFGILVAVGRLSADSELVALRSCGVSLFYLYRPILLLSVLLTAFNALLMVYALPRGNHALQQLRLAILTKSVSQQVQPRVFYEEWEGLVLYVFEVPPGQKRWRGIFLAEEVPGSQNRITVADWGGLRVDRDGERLILQMENAVVHEVDTRSPGRYKSSAYKRLTQVVQDRFTSDQRARIAASKGLRELTISELQERAGDRKVAAQIRNLARVEIHKKFAIPAACLVFGLLALPLGFSNRRGGRSSSFALSIAVILLYYVLLTNGEEAARVSKLSPWLAMWLPNLLLTALGLWLLVRRNQDKSLVITALLHRWQERLAPRLTAMRRRRKARRRLRRRHRAAPDVVVRIPRPRLRFPNLLDRYVIRLFVWVFSLVAVSAVTIYIIADLTETVDDILNNEIAGRLVFDYYKYMSLQIFFELAPILVLVTTLICFALLSRSNEVIAAKALGISLYRLSLPTVVAAIVVSLFSAFLESSVLPAANEKVAQLKDRIAGREAPRTYRRADRQWLFGQGRYIYNYLHYDDREQVLQRLQVFELDDRYRVTRRLFAGTARYAGDAWVFRDAWVRSFDGPRVERFEPFSRPVLGDYPETPAYFESEIRGPEQMSYGELRDYIEELEQRGQAVPELEVELHNKVAFPVVSLVMGLVALPFAFRLGRRGALYGIGVAVVLGMVFLGMFAFFTTLGETGALPPPLAVWAPSIAFALLSVYLFLGVRT